jgi:DNA-binding IclR family transcriptional regulator
MKSKPSENGGTIQSALDVLRLVNIMAEDFQPRTLREIVELCESKCWSQSKCFAMLATLEAAEWVHKREGIYSLSPYLARIAYAWTQHVTERAATLLAEVAAVKGTTLPPLSAPPTPPTNPNPEGNTNA